jgi:putative transposase
MEERKKFIDACRAEEESLAAICRHFGISTKTGYKWLTRYNALGEAGLVDLPRVALTVPHRTDEALLEAILALRKDHPTWGPKKLRASLQGTRPELVWPAASTIGDVLKRYGLIRPRRRRVRATPSGQPLGAGLLPNDVWCVDFKGHFALGDGTRCHPLTLTDQCSRYLLKCEALVEPKTAPVKREFERAFVEFGLPLRIRSDNGPPFASVGAGGLSALSVWWIKLGIVPERIEPAKPQQNARHERMHRTLKAEATQPPGATQGVQQLEFDRFRREYNDVRPHEALGQKPPATRYEPSPRPYPHALRSPEYGDEFKVRWVHSSGSISWRGEPVSIAKCLGGEPVGVRQVTETQWEVHYGPAFLGVLDDRDKEPRLRRVQGPTLGISTGDGDALRAFPVDSPQSGPAHREAPSPDEAPEHWQFWAEDDDAVDDEIPTG